MSPKMSDLDYIELYLANTLAKTFTFHYCKRQHLCTPLKPEI